MNATNRIDARAREELRWHYDCAPAELGCRASPIEPSGGSPKCVTSKGPSNRSLRASDRQRRVLDVLHRLSLRHQAVLEAMHWHPKTIERNEPVVVALGELFAVAMMGDVAPIGGRESYVDLMDLRGDALEEVRVRAQAEADAAFLTRHADAEVEVVLPGYRQRLRIRIVRAEQKRGGVQVGVQMVAPESTMPLLRKALDRANAQPPGTSG